MQSDGRDTVLALGKFAVTQKHCHSRAFLKPLPDLWPSPLTPQPSLLVPTLTLPLVCCSSGSVGTEAL